MLDLIIGPSYEDVYLIGRVLLADRSEHQVLFLVNFSEIYSISKMAALSKIFIAYIHLPDSSKKDDYLTTIFLPHVSSVSLGRLNKELDLDPTPARSSVSSFPIIPQ
jgi:hypothetical protein